MAHNQQPPTEIIDTLQEAEGETVTLHFDHSIGWPLGSSKKMERKFGEPPHITTLTAEVDLVTGADSDELLCLIEVGEDEMKRVEVFHEISEDVWKPNLRAVPVSSSDEWERPELVASTERSTHHVAAVTRVERHGVE